MPRGVDIARAGPSGVPDQGEEGRLGRASGSSAGFAIVPASADDGSLSPLAAAVRHGNLATVLQRLGEGANPNERDALGETPLFEAAACGRANVVAALLASRAEVHRRSLAGGCALDVCANRGTHLLLTLFRGVHLDEELEALALEGVSPFLRRALWPELRRCRAEAAARGEAEAVAAAAALATPETPLALAVQADNLGRVLELLQGGADPNQADAVGETPLFEAAAAGSINMAAALLLASADPHRQSASGTSALDFSATASMRLLLEFFRGESLERLDDEAEAPCLAELSGGLRPAVVEALGRRRRELAVADEEEAAPEMKAEAPRAAPAPAPQTVALAAERAAPGAATPAAEPEAAPSAPAPAVAEPPGEPFCDSEEEACSPLALAVRAQDFALVRVLLERRADPNEADALGETPLFEAAVAADTNVAAALLLAGADPRARSMTGMVAESFASGPAMKALFTAVRGESPEPAASAALQAELQPDFLEALWHRSVGLGVTSRIRQGSSR
uniref:Uncharacterized protein n=1 Tax=Alexandrium monilatum TaxID=311494 RepID=A0A7S4SM32_9DINO